MSLAINENIKVVGVRDPRTVVNDRVYAILKGSSSVTFTPFQTSNVSSSSISYASKVPSPYIFVNKYLYHLTPVRIQLTSSAPVTGVNLLAPGFDALRAFPLEQATQTVSATINGSTVSQNIGDTFSAMIHYNTEEQLRHTVYSQTPSYLDQSQNYEDVQACTRNPLGFYGCGYGDMTGGRASHDFTIVHNSDSMAIIDTVLCSPLFMSPFYFGTPLNNGGSAFIGLNNIDIQYVFYNNAGFRMWSHCDIRDTVNPANNPGKIDGCKVAFTNFSTLFNADFSYKITNPQLLFEYLTPQDIQNIPRELDYPYFKMDRFIVDYKSSIPKVTNYNIIQTYTITSQNIIMNSMPKRIYIWVRNNNDVMLNGLRDSNGVLLRSACAITDTFASIEQINLNINNRSGILSSCKQNDLYNISVRGGCQMNYQQWSGALVYKEGSFSEKIGLCGSVLSLTPGIDFGLDSDLAPGCAGNFNIQLAIQIKNTNTQYEMNPSLFIVCISEGIMHVANGQVNYSVGVLSPIDVLNSTENTHIVDYDDVMSISGGDFLSGMKSFGEKILGALKTAWQKVGKRVAPIIEQFVPASKPVFDLAREYLEEKKGKKKGGTGVGGDLVIGSDLYHRGGAIASKKSLKKRLKQRLR